MISMIRNPQNPIRISEAPTLDVARKQWEHHLKGHAIITAIGLVGSTLPREGRALQRASFNWTMFLSKPVFRRASACHVGLNRCGSPPRRGLWNSGSTGPCPVDQAFWHWTCRL